jgi:hypothetical protein
MNSAEQSPAYFAPPVTAVHRLDDSTPFINFIQEFKTKEKREIYPKYQTGWKSNYLNLNRK